MSTIAWVAVAVVGAALLTTVILIPLTASFARSRRERKEMRNKFGTEYDRLANERGPRAATAELRRRLEEHDDLGIERLPPDSRDALSEDWRMIQFRFVDEPSAAVREADHLVFETMRLRGLPVETLDARASALSVEAPELATQYRWADGVARSADQEGDVDVAQLHGALVTYRDVFEHLMVRPQREQAAAETGPPSSGAVDAPALRAR